jgi:hypothetical protein
MASPHIHYLSTVFLIEHVAFSTDRKMETITQNDNFETQNIFKKGIVRITLSNKNQFTQCHNLEMIIRTEWQFKILFHSRLCRYSGLKFFKIILCGIIFAFTIQIFKMLSFLFSYCGIIPYNILLFYMKK